MVISNPINYTPSEVGLAGLSDLEIVAAILNIYCTEFDALEIKLDKMKQEEQA